MIRALCLVALAFAAVSAQRWPMITVNAAGDIVLQSLTRAGSFQLTPAAATTAPTSGTAGASTAYPLPLGNSLFQVTTATTVVAGHGVSLPVITSTNVGFSVTLLQGQTSFVSYTVWAPSGAFINADSTTTSLVIMSRRVSCTSVSTSRWNCVQDNYDNSQKRVDSTSSTTVQLTADQSGSVLASTASFTTYTLPSCSGNNIGMQFQFASTQAVAALVAATNYGVTIKTSSGDYVAGTVVRQHTGTTAIASSLLGHTAATNTNVHLYCSGTAAVGATNYNYDATLVCVSANKWSVVATWAQTTASAAGAANDCTLVAAPIA